MMSKVKLIRLGACCLFLVFGFVSQAHASPTSVPYFTTAFGPVFFSNGDNFSLTGQSGFLTLDTVASTVNVINTANLTVKFCPFPFNNCIVSEGVFSDYFLSLDGSFNGLPQSGTWATGFISDSIVMDPASSPVLFVTGAGSWDVTLNSYILSGPGGTTTSLETTATFTPVPPSPTPEPGSMLLLGTGLLLAGGIVRRRLLSF